MFSKELENLINASLEDGVLEEYEKAAIVKRAQAEGVDLTELEIYINSILQRRKRELNEKKEEEYKELERQKQNEIGKVCPKCGKQVPPLTLVCDCGFEFTQAKQSSSNLLQEKIDAIYKTYRHSDKDEQRDQAILDAITLFPVPNTKEDIVDFLSLCLPNAKMKGGIFGSKIGRVCVGSIFIAIISIIVYILCPETHTESVSNGIFSSGYHEETTESFDLLMALLIFLIGEMMVAIVSIEAGKDTLRWNKFARVWRAKFDQVLTKGRSLRSDAVFQQQLDYYERQINM